MTTLKCDVRNCSHNQDDYCCLTAIEIDGNGATNVEDTCCSNFISTEYEMSNCTHDKQEALKINCSAAGCIYNQNRKCTADMVLVSGASTACCSHDTQCGTFVCR